MHLEEDAERKGKEAKKRGKRLPLGSGWWKEEWVLLNL